MKIYVATIDDRALRMNSRPSYYASQKRLFLFVLAMATLLPLMLQVWTSAQEYRKSWMDRASLDLLGHASANADKIQRFLDTQHAMLASYMELYSKENLTAPGRLERLFEAAAKGGFITDLGVISASGANSGAHLAYAGPYKKDLISRNYAGSTWFERTHRSGSYTSDVFLGYRGVPHIVVARASSDGSWILRATINSEMFSGLLSSAEESIGGEAFILNKKGELQTTGRQGTRSLPPIALNKGANMIEGSLVAVEPVKGGEWLLVLRKNADSSLAGYYSARRKDLLVMAIALCAVVGLAAWIARRLIDRIEEADRMRSALSDRVRQAEKMALVGRMAASVAHEVNNPLQVIGEQAGLMREMVEEEQAISAERKAEYAVAAESIQRSVKRASTVTHRLLGFSRSRGSERAATDINTLINETVGFVEKEAARSGILIRKQLSDNLPETLTDSCQLQQVFLNILNNAIEAVGQGGVVSVRTAANCSSIMAEFADSGPGLPKGEPAERVFEPFFTTKAGRGTGLGLSISYNIIERLGGRIEARNGSHTGSVFTVRLPLIMKEDKMEAAAL